MPKWIPDFVFKPIKSQKKKEQDLKLYTTMTVSTHEELQAAFFFGLQKYLKEKDYKLPSNIFPTQDKALESAIQEFFNELDCVSNQISEGSIKRKNKK